MNAGALLLTMAITAFAQSHNGPLTLSVRGPVEPVASDGKFILAYEVELANTSAQDLSLV